MPEGSPGAAALEARELRHQFSLPGRSFLAVENVSFTVRPGQFLSIVGPSGCGKSTVLQIAAGLLSPTAGQVTLGGLPVSSRRLDVTYIFQQYTKSILPWL